jgi:polyhydroxybutyrate depolymerase
MWKIVQEVGVATLLCLLVGIGVYMVTTETPSADLGRTEGSGEATSVANPPVEDVVDSLSHGGRQRQYLVHVPRGARPDAPVPVVLNFHDAQARAAEQRAQSRMNEVADTYRFLVVYPEGTEWTFNVGPGYGLASSAKVDDVGFTATLIDDLVRKYGADPRRVYATGLGNGAMLCYRLACLLPGRIAAIGPVGGDLPIDKDVEAARPVPVPVLHLHGLQDPLVPFGGGLGAVDVQQVPHRSIRTTIDWWVKWNRCSPLPAETVEKKDYTYTRYAPTGGGEGAPVVLYVLPGGGHTWPGGLDLTSGLKTGPLVSTLDASTILWKFFEPFSLPGSVEQTADGTSSRAVIQERR